MHFKKKRYVLFKELINFDVKNYKMLFPARLHLKQKSRWASLEANKAGLEAGKITLQNAALSATYALKRAHMLADWTQ